jgi:hypothetical protein
MVAIDHIVISGKFSQLCTGMVYFGPYECSLYQSEPPIPAETRMNDLAIFSCGGLHKKVKTCTQCICVPNYFRAFVVRL